MSGAEFEAFGWGEGFGAALGAGHEVGEGWAGVEAVGEGRWASVWLWRGVVGRVGCGGEGAYCWGRSCKDGSGQEPWQRPCEVECLCHTSRS